MERRDALAAFDGIVLPLRVDGTRSGPLAATTFVVKDLYAIRGYPTGAGNPDWKRTHAAATSTAPAVERLLEAGATLVGKSCSDELAFSLDGINIHYGTPLNPRSPDRLPGGSSSGSASAVAAGLVDFALGTDTSGSIRIPASYCGIYGFRPSHGAVPVADVVPLAPSFDTAGWLARDARTLARCGRVLLAGQPRGEGDAAPPLGALFVLDDAFDLMAPAETARLSAAVESLTRLFAGGRRIRLGAGGLAPWRAAFSTLKQWEAWRAHGAWIRAVNPHFAPNIRANFEEASRVTDVERARAFGGRGDCLAAITPYLRPDAVLCLPTAWAVAPLKSASAQELADNRAKNMALGSLAGLARAPQISIPVPGSDVGLSLIAAHGRDRELLALAEHLERTGLA